MGLFDFLKREKDSSDSGDVAVLQKHRPKFKPITIDTINVEKDLQKISKRFDIDIKKLDFTLISYRTFYRFDKKSKYKVLNEINSDEILTIKNFLDPNFSIKQQYKINIFEKKANSNFPIKIALGANKDFTKITAIFKKRANIVYSENLDSQIYSHINNKKLKLGLLIGIFDEILKENIKKVTSHIMVNKALIEDIKIDVCEGIHRVEESKEYVNLIYKEKKAKSDEGVNLKKRSNLYTVKKDELIIEVIKQRAGQDGRNCKGEFLPKISSKEQYSKFKYDEISFGDGLKVVELDDRVEIYAKKDGYVVENDKMFDVSEDLVVEQINLKTTGSIEAGESDIKVNVQNSDESLDAIASGVVLNTKEVKVKGNVASNAKITASLVEIDGQTHQSSQINGKKVKIYLHRGFVEADKVDIGTLEGGVVIGDEVFVDTLSGGEVRAKKIFINRLISNATLMASESIELNQLDGNSNKFIIDPKAQRGYDDIVKNIQKELDEIEHSFNKKNKELKSLKKRILADRESIEEIKEIVKSFKEKNKKAPSVMINKLKEDKTNKLEFNKLANEIKDLKTHKEELKEKLKNFNNISFDSTIVINSPWKEYNEVIFRIVEPAREIVRVMEEGEVANRLGLKVTKDNDYIIANLD